MLWQMINLLKTPYLLLLFIVFLIIPLLFSIVFHEIAHGFIAYKLGDETPKITGRLTFNPLKHLDILGTILLLTIGLGWAKPVLINPNNISTRKQQILVSVAGPFSNILLALIFAGIISILENYTNVFSDSFIITLFHMVVTINLALAVFNLIPLPPLDGSKIVACILPDNMLKKYYQFEQYGMFIILLIMFTVGFGGIFKFTYYIQNYLYILLKVTV